MAGAMGGDDSDRQGLARSPKTSPTVTPNSGSRTNTSLGMDGRSSTLGGSRSRISSDVRLQAQQSVSLHYMARSGRITRRDVLRSVLKKRALNSKGCLTLPVTVAFSGLFAFTMRLHEEISFNFVLDSAVRRNTERRLESLQSIADVWVWLHGDFVKEFFVQTDIYGEKLPPELWSRVLAYSQVQGSVVLRQMRPPGEWGARLDSSDDYMESLQAASEGFVPHVGAQSSRRLTLMRPEIQGVLQAGARDDATYEFLLWPNMPAEETAKRLKYLDLRNWLDENTSQLEVQAILLNVELGRPRLLQVVLLLAFGPSGGVYYKVSLEPLFLSPFPGQIAMLADGLWFAMLLGNSYLLVKNSLLALVEGRVRRYLSRPGPALEWFIVVGGWAQVLIFWAVHFHHMDNVRQKLEVVRSLDRTSDIAVHNGPAAELHAATEAMAGLTTWYRTGLASYTLLLMFRFFLAFGAHPRLAVVVNTLRVATIKDTFKCNNDKRT